MTESRFLLDTNAAIFLTTAGNVIPGALQEELNEEKLLTSIIVRMELLSKRNMQDDEEQVLFGFLNTLTVIPINDDIEQTAIALRRSAKLKLPDAIIAATSIVLDAVLLTDDHHLLDLSWPGFKAQKIN